MRGAQLELASVLDDAVEKGGEELSQMAENLRCSLPPGEKAGESAQPKVVVGPYTWQAGGYPGQARVTVDGA